MEDKVQRRSDLLYGPQRLLAAEEQARTLKEDSFRLKGIDDDVPYNPTSTARDSFKNPVVLNPGDLKTEVLWDSAAQHKTSIALGYSKSCSTSLFKDEFTAKPQQYKGLTVPQHAHENHWADCNPKYTSGERTAPSVYDSDYDGSKSYREWLKGAKTSGQKVGRRNKTTAYQKSTHFSLGSDTQDMSTETQKHFNQAPGSPTDPPLPAPLPAPPTSSAPPTTGGPVEDLSFVFRSGDYNVARENPSERFRSINKGDYLPRETTDSTPTDSTSESFTGLKYQTSTHFEFGTERGSEKSVYYQDFVKGGPRGVPAKETAPPPLGGKVLPESVVGGGESWGATTHRSTYQVPDVGEGAAERLDDMLANQARHQELAVTLTCRDSTDPLTTVMRSSYTDRSRGGRPADAAPPPNSSYRHLESSDALPNPSRRLGRSEAQDSYRGRGGLGTGEGPVNAKRLARRTDNENTHFQFGSDEKDTVTEQMAEYRPKSPIAEDLLPAGVTYGPSLDYSIVSHDVDMCHLQPTPSTRSDKGCVASSVQNVLLQRTLLKMDPSQDLELMKMRKAFLQADNKLEGKVSREKARAICAGLDLALPQQDLADIIDKCSDAERVDYHALSLTLLKLKNSSALQDPHTSSTTERDYTDPSIRKLTAMQQLVYDTDHKRFVPSQPSHYFHKDPSKDSPMSTARKDYIHPARM